MRFLFLSLRLMLSFLYVTMINILTSNQGQERVNWLHFQDAVTVAVHSPWLLAELLTGSGSASVLMWPNRPVGTGASQSGTVSPVPINNQDNP